MLKSCFNCASEISSKDHICPNCYAVQRKIFTRDDLFDILEKEFPTKPTDKERFVSTKIRIKPKGYRRWLTFGIFTLGIAYYYYLLMVFKNLSDHWYYPHGKYENSTKIDMLVVTLILVFTNFLGIPFIQYVKYEKLRRHLQNDPQASEYKIPVAGKTVFWIYSLFNVLFMGTVSMLFFGISSIVAGKYFEFETIMITIVFFVIAGTIFALAMFLAIQLSLFERNWQKQFNQHINWHYKSIRRSKKQRSRRKS